MVFSRPDFGGKVHAPAWMAIALAFAAALDACSDGAPAPSGDISYTCNTCDRVPACCEAESAAEGRDGGTCPKSAVQCEQLPLDIQSEYISSCVAALQRGAAEHIAACQ